MPVVDTSDAAHPKHVVTWTFDGDGRAARCQLQCRRNTHGTARSRAISPRRPARARSGRRVWWCSIPATSPAHKPNPQIRTLGKLFWKDGGQFGFAAAGQDSPASLISSSPRNWAPAVSGASARAAACAQQLPPFGFPKIIDISDDTKPREVAKLMLEVDDPANCSMTMGEATNPAFVYDSHYCNVDDQSGMPGCSYAASSSKPGCAPSIFVNPTIRARSRITSRRHRAIRTCLARTCRTSPARAA